MARRRTHPYALLLASAVLGLGWAVTAHAQEEAPSAAPAVSVHVSIGTSPPKADPPPPPKDPLPAPPPLAGAASAYPPPPPIPVRAVRADEPAPSTAWEDDHRVRFTALDLGARGWFIVDPSIDLYAERDGLPAFSMGVSQTVAASNPTSIAVGIRFDAGGVGATSRGTSASLKYEAYGVSLEARWHWLRQVYGFVRAVPQALRLRTSWLSETYQAEKWAFGADLSVGTAVMIGPSMPGTMKVARVWVAPEVGYGIATRGPSELRSVTSSNSDRNLPVTVDALSLHGPFLRISALMTY